MIEPTEEAMGKLRDYVDDVRGRMNLGQWSLRLSDQHPENDRQAGTDVIGRIDPVDGRYLAVIRLALRFWDDSPEEQRETVVHELAHLYHQPMTGPLEFGPVEKLIGTAAWAILRDVIDRGAEQMTDHLTKVLAEFMPLPELPKLGA